MKRNVGTIDRILRILAGIALVAWGIHQQSWIGAIGLLPLLTAIVGFCPAYVPLGISTTGKRGGGCGCGHDHCD